MKSIKIFTLQNNYIFRTKNETLGILAHFLLSDASLTFKEWALANKSDPSSCFRKACGGNMITLEEDHEYIFFTDSVSSYLTDLIMSREQFVQLLTDWEEKVINLNPKNVIIIERNNKFIIETNNYGPEAHHVNLMLEHNFYERIYESSFEMAIIGFFLSRDVRWDYVDYFKTWTTFNETYPAKNKRAYAVNDTIVTLERTKDYIYFTNENPDDDPEDDEITIITYLKIPTQQFLQLLNDWQEKVCNQKPKRVCIKHENDEFTIETSN